MDIQLLSLILGIIGTIGTIIGGVFAFIRSRVRLSIEIIAWLQAQDCLFIYAVITNKSLLAISISSIFAILDGAEIPCSLYPFVVQYRKLPGEEGEGKKEPVRSLPFPLNLGPLSGVAGYLYFRTPQPISQPLSTHLYLLAHTSRKGRVKMKCKLQEDALLHTRYFETT